MFNSRIEIPNTFYYFRNLKIRLRCDRNFVIIKSWDKTLNRTEDHRGEELDWGYGGQNLQRNKKFFKNAFIYLFYDSHFKHIK